MDRRSFRDAVRARHANVLSEGESSTGHARHHVRWQLVDTSLNARDDPTHPNPDADTSAISLFGPNFFVDSGLRTPPSAWIGNPGEHGRFVEHPKLRRLLDLKHALVQCSAIPPTFLNADLRAWLPTPTYRPSLGVLESLQYDVILIDPPLASYAWNMPHEPHEHHAWSWDDIAQLPISQLASRDSFVFLWVGDGRDDGLERGRDALHRWGYRRCEDIVWVRTDSCDAYAPSYSSLFTPVVHHCLMGIRGTVVRSTDSFFVHCNVDTDVILWPGERPAPDAPISPIRKPPELYTLIENFCLGTRRLELFGTNRNLRRGWLTVGCDVGPHAPMWLPSGAMPFDPRTYMSYFVFDPPGCPLYARSNLVPYNEECEALRPQTPPPKGEGAQVPYYLPGQRPFRMQPPRSQLLNQGAGGRTTVSVPSSSERFSGAQAKVVHQHQELMNK